MYQKGEKSACLAKIVTVFDQKFRLSRLLPRTILLDFDTGADDARTNNQRDEKLAYLTKSGRFFRANILVKSSSSPHRPALL